MSFGLLDLGTGDLIIILVIVLLLFGGKKLPELSRSVGESLKELRKGVAGTQELKDEVKNQVAKTQEAINSKPKPKA